MKGDRSNGWEAVATRFVVERSATGAATVRHWRRALPADAVVLDLGCGCGEPIAAALLDEGCRVRGVDASPSLVAEFQRRFPGVPVANEPVEESDFFGETYDGVVAIGLLFLLPPEIQQVVVGRIAAALKPAGRFLFTAPTQAVAWHDSLTGRLSVSLGDETYRRVLADVGLRVAQEYVDEGGNHYYDAEMVKRERGC